MLNVDIATFKLLKAQDAFDPIAVKFKAAQNALKRSKSQKNIVAYEEALAAWCAAYDEIQGLYADVDLAAEKDAAELVAFEKAEHERQNPTFI